MNISNKGQIKTYLLDYFKSENPNLKFVGDKDLFCCPICQKSEPTANFYPKNKNKIHCFNPVCNFTGDIFDLVRKTKKNFSDSDDNEIGTYLIHKLKIKIKNEIDDLIQLYKDADFALIPLIGGHSDPKMNKIPIKEAKEWEKSCHKNPVIWKDWIERGYNIGLNLGKVSNVIAIDIDSDDTYEKLKDMLGDTLIQTTKRGHHFLYNYDSDFDNVNHANLRSQGYEMELRANNAYIVIAPSSVEGEVREWNNQKMINMPKELKEFLIPLLNSSNNKSQNDKIQEAIDKGELNIKDGLRGLDGNCNDTFIKLGGILRKKLTIENTKWALNTFNKALNEPMDNKVINGMINQLQKYKTYDKQELAKIVLERLDIIKEGTAYQISSSLRYEQKDIEEVLKYLEDENKIVDTGNRKYKKLQEVEWEQDFTDLGVPVDFEVPYFHSYASLDKGNMILIGAKTGGGKTHITGNIIKKLVDQNIHPYLISTEAGSKIGKVCKYLGINIGDFSFKTVDHPTDIELKDNVVTIIDWLKPKHGDYAKTESTFEHFNHQLQKHSGFLIILVQLRQTGEFFAIDQISNYSALTAKYCYDETDNENTYFQTTKIRDSRTGLQYITIPTKFDPETKLLELK